jgi:hypothetical protein
MPSGRTLLIVGIITVIVIAAAVALSLSGVRDHGGSSDAMRLAANTAPSAPAQSAPPGLSRMQLQAQYMGPLRDTVIQRWRDPIDGTICYLYLPVIVQHAPGPNNLVQYGANTIGSISCLHSGG